MTGNLPEALRQIVAEYAEQLTVQGFVVDARNDLDRIEKRSFGVHIEAGGRGFSLSAWDTCEVQQSSIDYRDDEATFEKYFEGVDKPGLRARFSTLLQWVSDGRRHEETSN